MIKAYQSLIKAENSLQSVLLLIIRLYCGWQFVVSGYSKMMDLEKVSHFLTELNIPFPYVSAYLVANTELFGGICLLIGFASRLVTIPLVFVMGVALITAHRENLLNIFSDPDSFIYQSAFIFFFISLVVMIFGPGMFSIDYLIARDKERI